MATVYLMNSGTTYVTFTPTGHVTKSSTQINLSCGWDTVWSGTYKCSYSCPSGSRVYGSGRRYGEGLVCDASFDVGSQQYTIPMGDFSADFPASNSTSIGFTLAVNGWNMGPASVSVINPTIYITYTQKYTVTVQAGTGISSVSGGGTVNEGSSVSINATVSTGYKWYRWESNGSSYTTTQNASVKPTSNLTLTAVGQPITYTIAYNSNGGSGSMSTTSATYNVYATLRANTFTKAKYIFKGWATSSGGTKTYDDQQSVRNLSTTQGATITLYAVWEKDPNAVFVNSTKVYASGWK